MSGAAAADDYDFFDRARYPGPGRKEGVDLYVVEQEGGPHAVGYKRRVVRWWPRRGVDIIPVRAGMIERTWTLRDRKMDPSACTVHPRLGMEELTRRLSSTQPRRFKAHLIGFRGIGNRYGDPFGPFEYFCPAVVLRLADGTKRCFTRGTFVEEDERFILGIYVREMERTRAGLSKAKYELGSGAISNWPNSAKPGQPGTMRVESEHFVWVSGSQHAPNEEYSPWVNRDEPDKARLYRDGSVAFAEDMWAYQEHAGVLMPFWDRHRRRKYEITVCGTYRDGYKWLAGYAGGGYGGCGIKHAGGGPWSLGLAHEWGHGLPLQTRVDGGGGEILADACQVVNDPARTEKFANNVRRPWRNCVHGSYGTGLFYAIMGDDPSWGYAMVVTLPIGRGEPSVFHTLARLGEQRGLFVNGIRGVGDMVGEFAARQAEFDCELQDGLRRGFMSVRRNYLEAVDRRVGLYRIPWAEAPEPFGANIIRLVAEKGARRIAVGFRGFHDRDTHGDWRACIVAVGADGKARYSPLWSKGTMELAIRPGDRRFWLTVAATPSALPTLPGRGGIGALLDGRHAYRYPYEVKLSGCRPGTPHDLPGDADDYDLTCLGGHRRRDTGGLCVVPHPGDTPEAARMREAVLSLRSRLEQFKRQTDRLVADGKIATGNWWYYRRFAPNLAFLDRYVGWMLDGIKGRRHPNGGGWVAASAEVAPTAYVARDAMVLDGARVLDHAAIEDFAVVRGPKAVVSGHAKVGGQAYVAGNVRIGGYTRVLHTIFSEDEQVVPSEVPPRPFQRAGDDGALWANYAMDRDETEVLEDWFRYKDESGVRWQFHVLNLNGHLYGRPEFVVDGVRRGFRFDGRTRYAEATPILADLGRITVDIGLKWEGGPNEVVFDFGSSMDNRLVLTPFGASGTMELIITQGGKTDRVIADAALPRGKWAQCRVEIDGKRIALWIDGRMAAERESTFRPADVYPAGAEKRNFVAAGRDATGHFKGCFDYLRVYHTVHDDFAKAPAPRRHAPRRISREFIDSCRKEYADTDLREELIRVKLRPVYASFEKFARERDVRAREIEDSSSPAVAEARRKLDEARRKLNQRRRELRAEFDKLPETVAKQAQYQELENRARELEVERSKAAEAREAAYRARNVPAMAAHERQLTEAKARLKQADAELRRLEEQLKKGPDVMKEKDEYQRAIRLAELKLQSADYLRWHRARAAAQAEVGRIGSALAGPLRAWVAGDPQLARLDRQIAALRSRARMLRPDSRTYLAQHTVELTHQVATAEMAVGEAIRKNIARHKPEYDWLHSFRWLAFSGHYNYPYRSFLRKRIAEGLGGKVCHENFGSLESIRRAQTEAKWHTRCDWQWRLAQELDGSIEELPLLQAWLERVRGPGRE